MADIAKRWLALLEKAFAAEIDSALSRDGTGLYQTRSKLAQALVDEGYLARADVALGGRFPIAIRGYRLTELGRLTYCMSCREAEDG